MLDKKVLLDGADEFKRLGDIAIKNRNYTDANVSMSCCRLLQILAKATNSKETDNEGS